MTRTLTQFFSSAQRERGVTTPVLTDEPGWDSRANVRNRPTPEGQQLGEILARWTDDAEPKARLRMPELPPRCNSCAFRRGPHLANGSPATQMDALKCIMEGVEFRCHEPAREGHICSGWAMNMLAREDGEKLSEMPWPFSDEPNTDQAQPALVRPSSQPCPGADGGGRG